MPEPSSAATHELRPRAATWTHVALRVRDIDASIHWYEEHTPLRLLDKRSDEFVTLTNVSDSRVDLEGYRLWSPGYTYAFTPPATIAPGDSMRVYTQGSAAEDEPLVKHWGLQGPVLGNNSDKVKLSTFDYIDVACQAWGTATC